MEKNVYICGTESLSYTAEINTTCKSTMLQLNKFFKKEFPFLSSLPSFLFSHLSPSFSLSLSPKWKSSQQCLLCTKWGLLVNPPVSWLRTNILVKRLKNLNFFPGFILFVLSYYKIMVIFSCAVKYTLVVYLFYTE